MHKIWEMHLQWDLCIALWLPSREMGLSIIIMNKGISFLLIYSTQFIGFFKREQERNKKNPYWRCGRNSNLFTSRDVSWTKGKKSYWIVWRLQRKSTGLKSGLSRQGAGHPACSQWDWFVGCSWASVLWLNQSQWLHEDEGQALRQARWPWPMCSPRNCLC